MLAHDCWKVEIQNCNQMILSVVFVMLMTWHTVVFHLQNLHSENCFLSDRNSYLSMSSIDQPCVANHMQEIFFPGLQICCLRYVTNWQWQLKLVWIHYLRLVLKFQNNYNDECHGKKQMLSLVCQECWFYFIHAFYLYSARIFLTSLHVFTKELG